MSEWISVEKSNPVGRDRLLCLEPEGEGIEPQQCVGYFNRLTQCWMVNGESYPGLPVTHWMPLPNPPEVQK